MPLIEFKIKNNFDLNSLWRLIRLFQKEKYDVVNTHSSVDSWVASLAARMARVPVLVRTRHLSVPVATHPLNVVYKWPDAVVTTSEMITRRLVEVNKAESRPGRDHTHRRGSETFRSGYLSR